MILPCMTCVLYMAPYLIFTTVCMGGIVSFYFTEDETRTQIIRQVAQGSSPTVSGRGEVLHPRLISKALSCSDCNSYLGRQGWDQLFSWAGAGTTGFWPEEGCEWEDNTCNWKEASWRRRATRCEKECGAAKPWTMGRTLACHFPPLEHTACSMFRCLQHLDPPPETGHPACFGLSAPPQTVQHSSAS